MTSTTDLLRLRAENEALKQSLQHESDVVEAAKEEIIRQRVENANQSEKINALVQERDRLLRAEWDREMRAAWDREMRADAFGEQWRSKRR